jgi:hypothetical protein
MDIGNLSHFVALAVMPLEVLVCALALQRRLWRTLPFFSAYLVLVVLSEAARWSVLLSFGERSRAYSWTYWGFQALLVPARGAVLVDLCRAALGLYSGVWQLSRYLLGSAALVMLSVAAVRTGSSRGVLSYVLYVEVELEFAIVVTLLLLLMLTRYYGVSLNRPLGGTALGLVFYSSVVITTSSIMTTPMALSWELYSALRSVAYAVALGLWAYALRLPLPAAVQPEMGTVESYERNTQVVSDRMRALNSRLLELMKR